MILAALLLVTVPQTPQAPPAGKLVGHSLYFAVDEATANQNQPLSEHSCYWKPAGLKDTLPDKAPVVTGKPDFRNAPWMLPNIVLGSLSTNTNVISTDPSGVGKPADGSWAGFAFGVTPDSLGEDDSVIRLQQAAGAHAATSYTYLFEGSEAPAPLVDQVYAAVRPPDVRLTGQNPAFIAGDLTISPLVSDDPNFGAAVDAFHGVAFTVAPESVDNIQNTWLQWVSPRPGTPVKSAATVFWAGWDSTSRCL